MPDLDRTLGLEPAADGDPADDGIEWQPLLDPKQLVDLIEE